MGRRGLEKTSQQGKLKSQWTKAFGCWIRRVRLPDFAPPTTPPGSAFLISLPLPLPLALSLSLWRDASTGMIDVGLSLEFTRLQRKWAMASVDPEVPPPPRARPHHICCKANVLTLASALSVCYLASASVLLGWRASGFCGSANFGCPSVVLVATHPTAIACRWSRQGRSVREIQSDSAHEALKCQCWCCVTEELPSGELSAALGSAS